MGSVDLEIKEAAVRSKLVMEAKHICKKFGEREIVKDFSLRVLKGNRIGIVGPNGSGKTTLVKLLTQHLAPDSGFVRLGKNLEMAYFDQNREMLDPDKTLWRTLCGEGDHIYVRGHYRHVIAYLKDFLFTPDQAQSPVSCLSGGEKNRLMLALSLARESNFLVLDEPTNDLDMDTLDLLQEVLDEYEGTILLVSHDRDLKLRHQCCICGEMAASLSTSAVMKSFMTNISLGTAVLAEKRRQKQNASRMRFRNPDALFLNLYSQIRQSYLKIALRRKQSASVTKISGYMKFCLVK